MITGYSSVVQTVKTGTTMVFSNPFSSVVLAMCDLCIGGEDPD